MDLNIANHETWMKRAKTREKYLMGQVATAQNANSKGGEELLKPEPGSWNTWQFNLMNLLSPYPQLAFHIEADVELPTRDRANRSPFNWRGRTVSSRTC